MKTRTKVAVSALGGAAVGAAMGVLFAPQSGAETRRDLKKKLDELVAKAKTINSKDVSAYIEKKVDEIKEALASLDKEKVKKNAINQAKKIKKDAESLAKYAKKKGSEELSKIADDLRDKAIEVTEGVLEKLEGKK